MQLATFSCIKYIKDYISYELRESILNFFRCKHYNRVIVFLLYILGLHDAFSLAQIILFLLPNNIIFFRGN